jgi:hypothetical protein
MAVFAIPVTINVTVHVSAEDALEAKEQVENDDIYWLEPVTQGDAEVYLSPAIKTTEAE